MTKTAKRRMSRVLVTGGAGFIGSHVVESLVERGTDVTIADNFSTGSMENLAPVAERIAVERVDIVRDDITPLLAREKFDIIIHAAGNASIPASVADARRDLEDNTVLTQALLEAVRGASPASAFVNISSATVYGEGRGDPMTEDDPTRPVSPYGVSKLAAELYVTLYARLYGLQTSSVRVFSVHGPRLRKQVVWDFMNRLAENPDELTIQGDGAERRDINHVRNIVEAILLVAARAAMNGEVFNVGSRESVSIDELARDLAAAMGLSPLILHTGRDRPGHARTWQADISRLESLGYRARVGYRDGLADTVAWFRRLPITSRMQ